MIVFLLFIFAFSSSWACSTNIAPEERIDCHPNPYNQTNCESIGCLWCPNVSSNIPHCFLNVSSNFHVLLVAAHNCRAANDCKVAINCHPDKITYSPNKASCESRGCLWLGAAAGLTRPRCVFYNNTILGLDVNQLFIGAFPMFEIGSICVSCDKCFYKLNCLPNEAPHRITERRCQREGCIWCEASKECLFGMKSALDIFGPNCTTCSNCPLHGYIKARSQAECGQRGGTYCPNRVSFPDDRRCALIPSTSSGECTVHKALSGKCRSCDQCDEVLDCSKLGNYETEVSCMERGCLWCPNNASKPYCRYGSSGYRCISETYCDIQFPRFQKIVWDLLPYQRPHLMKLMEVLCYSQLGVWAPSTSDKCLSASPVLMSPLMRRITKIFQYYHYMHYFRFHLAHSVANGGIDFQ